MTLPAHLGRYAGPGIWSGRTIGDCARARAEADPDRIVFPDEPAGLTFAALLADGEALAVALHDLGLRAGDVVSFLTPNWVEAAIVNLAAALGGYVVNPIVPIYRDAEVLQMLSDGGAKTLFVCGAHRKFDYGAMIGRLRGDLPALAHVIGIRTPSADIAFADLLKAGRGRALRVDRVEPDSAKLLLYTSGTTGRPKGVLHSHNTLMRVTERCYAQWGVAPGDTILMPSPVTHASGYSHGLEEPFVSGTRTVLMEHWDARQAIDLIHRHEVTGTVAATPFLKELADRARATGDRLPGFRFFGCGGAAVPRGLVQDANEAFAQPCAFRVYGSSEVPLVTLGYDPSLEPELASESDGAVIDYEVRLVDDEGRDVQAGDEGEILVRGPSMFLGYADATQTREAITEDGYFRTGDIGRLTARGSLTITGRKKDLIIRGGENISAKEIEDVLQRHPAVIEAAVVAMPHERLGEGICAFVITRDETHIDQTGVAAFIAEAGLARQKTPERVECVTEFPRTASGKIRKDILRGIAGNLVARDPGRTWPAE